MTESLSASEREFLLAGLAQAAHPPSDREAKPHPPQPAGMADVQKRLLFETVHLSECRQISGVFCERLGIDCEVDLVRFGAFRPTDLAARDFERYAVSSRGLQATLRVCWERRVLETLFDRMLGAGSGDRRGPASGRESADCEFSVPPRPLTAIESRLADRLNRCLSQALERAWQPVLDLELGETVGAQGHPVSAAASPAIHGCLFEIRVDALPAGRLQVEWPQTALQQHGEALALIRLSSPSCDRRPEPLRETDRSAATEEVVVQLATTRLDGRELAELQVGDLIVTNQPAVTPLRVMVDGKPAFEGRAGAASGYKAVLLQRRVPADSESRE